MVPMDSDHGRILISTHDLNVAGTLRDAFENDGYRVELVTPGEDVSTPPGAELLVLTGGLPSPEAAAMAHTAVLAHQAPVLGVDVVGETPSSELAAVLTDVFGPGARPDEVLFVGRSLVERRRLQALTGIVGQTDAIQEALARIVQVAPVDSTVLITGESGTGKELAARGIHALSRRRHNPFIAVNVAALSEALLESELFGHEKGAFTGAIDSRKGLFELADGGTIFLDEIGEMPVVTQTKLLRVLEQREFLRVGGEKLIKVDVRIVAATNQELRQLVAVGGFRKDLYYRLNVLHIELPPLRRRREDIPLLVTAFVQELSHRLDRPFLGISDGAMELLKNHQWPGNVRELQNLVESMVVLAPGREIVAADIPDVAREAPGSALPVPLGPGSTRALVPGDSTLRPELEFVFRTLVDLRMDVDDLRREFDVYREERPPGASSDEDMGRVPPAGEIQPEVRSTGREWMGTPAPQSRDDYEIPATFDREAHIIPDLVEDVVVYRPGMSMEDIEREVISVALAEVNGNRRKAAELLAIGERTLYRKIKKFGLEVEGK
jgi:DNA-binding NtrC family response regulator